MINAQAGPESEPTAAESDAPGPRARPGGRSARVRQAIHAATLELLVESGLAGVTLPAVARRAGVHKTTVYRRWRRPMQLIRDALVELEDVAIPEVDNGSWEGDVEAFATSFTRYLSNPAASGFMRAIIAIRPSDPELGAWVDDFWRARRQLWLVIIERAIARKELEPTARAVPLIELIAGPLLLTQLVTDLHLGPREISELSATIAAGVRARHGVNSKRPAKAKHA